MLIFLLIFIIILFFYISGLESRIKELENKKTKEKESNISVTIDLIDETGNKIKSEGLPKDHPYY